MNLELDLPWLLIGSSAILFIGMCIGFFLTWRLLESESQKRSILVLQALSELKMQQEEDAKALQSMLANQVDQILKSLGKKPPGE